MILCVCNALTEEEVRAAARQGASCPDAAFAALGFEPQCGTCLCHAQELIDDELRRASAPAPRRAAPQLRIVAA